MIASAKALTVRERFVPDQSIENLHPKDGTPVSIVDVDVRKADSALRDLHSPL